MARNGFAAGAVTVLNPQVPDPTATPPVLASAQAVVSVSVAPLIAGLFTGSSAVAINAAATASMRQMLVGGTACVLSTSGDLTIAASQTVVFSPCTYVSNAGDATAINVTSGSMNVFALVTAGECSGSCPASSSGTSRPVSTFQPVVADPYQTALAAIPLPTSSEAISGTITCLPDPVD